MKSKNSKSLFKGLLLVFALGAMAIGLVACGGNPNPGTSTTATTTVPSPDNPGGDKTGTGDQNVPTATYHISFYTGEGATQIEQISGIKAGDTITAPEDPKLARHAFEGWYLDYGVYAEKFTFSTMPAKNLCLYAKWSETASSDDLQAYENDLKETSEEGHLYIHYLRFNNDPKEYEQLSLWLWPYQYVGRTWDWNRDANGDIVVDDIAGAVCDIDLTKKYHDAGKEPNNNLETQFLKDNAVDSNYTAGAIRNEENYMNPQIGFLIVYTASKNVVGSHWRSDGNADQFINIKECLWDNGSIHIFCVQDNISSYVTHITEQGEVVNPYASDDGNSVSISNVNSSENLKLEHGTQLFDTVNGVGYQIMVSSFADSNNDGMGDIRGIINNFDYIEKLNVDVIWLTPIQLSDSYHGYDIIDYKVVDPKFGTTGKTDKAAQDAALADYKELITLCHSKGIKVIMDLVLNHTSTNNVWFQNSAKMKTIDGIEYRNFYQWRNHEKEKDLSKDWYPYSEYAYSYYGKFSPSMPELNYDYQGTRDAIVDVALYWLGILGEGKGGVDGFRIDAVKHIYMADEVTPNKSDIIIKDYDTATQSDYSSNLTKNINFFTEFANRIKAKYPNTYLVGENFDGHAYNVAPYYSAFDGMLDFYMYYQFGEIAQYPTSAASKAGNSNSRDGSLPNGINTNLLRNGIWNYQGVLETQQAYSKNGLNNNGSGNADVVGSLFTSNHDLPRLMNNMVNGTVTASNSARGEKYAKGTISTMMMLPGISWIYYGDELGMSSNYAQGEDAHSGHADRAYRQPFKWEKNATAETTHFSISGDTTLKVEWDSYNRNLNGVKEQLLDEGSFLNTVRYWTNIKKTDDVIRYGDYKYKPVDWGGGNIAPALFSFTRSYAGHTYWIVTNFDDSDYTSLSVFNNYTLKYVTPGGSKQTLPSGGTIVVEL